MNERNRRPAVPDPERLTGERIEAIRSLSLEEHGRLLEAACRAAAEIERGRIETGLRPSGPAPWPPSTIAFLRKHAPDGRRRGTGA
ncbi:MAG: hypothetical protein JXP34_22765 [Planctomycetes bacterium]|nr:hypothetical protein [Planctomycetota bacterium]